jgi:hypothetical protein
MGNLMPGQNLSAGAPYVLAYAVPGETAPATIDPLRRTITVRLSADANATDAQWTLFPAASTAKWSAATAEAAPTLTVTAPDGRVSVWRVIRAP